MVLKITYTEGSNKDIAKFCEWLIPYIRSYANDLSNLDIKMIKKWDNYLETIKPQLSKKPIHLPSFKEIVNNYFSNLIVLEEDDAFIITHDFNKKAPSGHAWDYFARLINFGTLDMKGYPYFEEVFEHFAKCLQLYYNGWSRRL